MWLLLTLFVTVVGKGWWPQSWGRGGTSELRSAAYRRAELYDDAIAEPMPCLCAAPPRVVAATALPTPCEAADEPVLRAPDRLAVDDDDDDDDDDDEEDEEEGEVDDAYGFAAYEGEDDVAPPPPFDEVWAAAPDGDESAPPPRWLQAEKPAPPAAATAPPPPLPPVTTTTPSPSPPTRACNPHRHVRRNASLAALRAARADTEVCSRSASDAGRSFPRRALAFVGAGDAAAAATVLRFSDRLDFVSPAWLHVSLGDEDGGDGRGGGEGGGGSLQLEGEHHLDLAWVAAVRRPCRAGAPCARIVPRVSWHAPTHLLQRGALPPSDAWWQRAAAALVASFLQRFSLDGVVLDLSALLQVHVRGLVEAVARALSGTGRVVLLLVATNRDGAPLLSGADLAALAPLVEHLVVATAEQRAAGGLLLARGAAAGRGGVGPSPLAWVRASAEGVLRGATLLSGDGVDHDPGGGGGDDDASLLPPPLRRKILVGISLRGALDGLPASGRKGSVRYDPVAGDHVVRFAGGGAGSGFAPTAYSFQRRLDIAVDFGGVAIFDGLGPATTHFLDLL